MKTIIGDTWQHWRAHHAPRMGAALAYYAILAVVPLLILIVTASSMLFSKDVVEVTLMHQLISTIGAGPATYISQLLHNTPLQDISATAVLLTTFAFLIGILGLFSELAFDLNQLWLSPKKIPKEKLPFFRNVLRFVREKIIVLSLIPVLTALLIASIAATLLLSIIQTKAGENVPFEHLVSLLKIGIPFIASSALFALIYRIVPHRTFSWRVLAIGGLVTAVLFVVGNVLITLYIRLLVHTDIFGTASSLVGLLVWMYYCAQVCLLGASYTFVYAKRKGLILSRDSSQ